MLYYLLGGITPSRADMLLPYELSVIEDGGLTAETDLTIKSLLWNWHIIMNFHCIEENKIPLYCTFDPKVTNGPTDPALKSLRIDSVLTSGSCWSRSRSTNNADK